MICFHLDTVRIWIESISNEYLDFSIYLHSLFLENTYGPGVGFVIALYET